MRNQECTVRPTMVNINSNEPYTFHILYLVFYIYSVLVNKCSGSCNAINDPHANLFVSDVVKTWKIKYFI